MPGHHSPQEIVQMKDGLERAHMCALSGKESGYSAAQGLSSQCCLRHFQVEASEGIPRELM